MRESERVSEKESERETEREREKERESDREREREKAIYLYVKSVSSVLSPIMYFEPDVRYIDIKNNNYLK